MVKVIQGCRYSKVLWLVRVGESLLYSRNVPGVMLELFLFTYQVCINIHRHTRIMCALFCARIGKNRIGGGGTQAFPRQECQVRSYQSSMNHVLSARSSTYIPIAPCRPCAAEHDLLLAPAVGALILRPRSPRSASFGRWCFNSSRLCCRCCPSRVRIALSRQYVRTFLVAPLTWRSLGPPNLPTQAMAVTYAPGMQVSYNTGRGCRHV